MSESAVCPSCKYKVGTRKDGTFVSHYYDSGWQRCPMSWRKPPVELSRSQTMRIIDSTGKYAAVVIGVLTNQSRDNAASARSLIDNDIKNLESALGIARTARQKVLEVEHAGCDFPYGGPCTCKESTGGKIPAMEEGERDGLAQESSK